MYMSRMYCVGVLVDGGSCMQGLGCAEVQFTLVDCPGHASLIRTILGGAHIIDMMLLVVDVTRGIQVRPAALIKIPLAHTATVL